MGAGAGKDGDLRQRRPWTSENIRVRVGKKKKEGRALYGPKEERGLDESIKGERDLGEPYGATHMEGKSFRRNQKGPCRVNQWRKRETARRQSKEGKASTATGGAKETMVMTR